MNEQHLQVAVAAARAGANELMSRRYSRSVREKAPKDLVTDADLASQKAIRSILMENFPNYAFVGEEYGETEPMESVRQGDQDAPPCWVVDPLDGTANYVHRLQSFAVSIGLYAAGRMRLGVIYDPVCEEMFTAIDGQGAFVNGQRMKVSGCEELDDSMLACSFPAGVQSDSPSVAQFVRMLVVCRSLRRLGSCALNMCYVADGRLDGYWATSVNSWDAAAGIVIAREAGASITGWDGSPLDDWEPKFCLTGSAVLLQKMVAVLANA